MNNQNFLKENLKKLREKNNYTQKDISKMLNIDRSTYSYYEIGKSEPNIKTLVELSKIFNVSVDDLLLDKKR